MKKNCSNCLANRTFWGKRSDLFLHEITERKQKCKTTNCISIYFWVSHDKKVMLQTLSLPFLVH